MADWQERFSLHLHVKWSGSDTAGGWRMAGRTGEYFLGIVMSLALLQIAL